MNTQLLLVCLSACIALASAQSQLPSVTAGIIPPPPPQPGTVRAATDLIAVLPLFCRVVPTATLLGFSPSTGVPVYQQACSGLCLSSITQRRTCQPTYTPVVVSSFPVISSRFVPTLLRTVQRVTSCSCQPAPCTSYSNGNPVSVPHGSTGFTLCAERCTCSYGTLINCCRQRKEFRTGMTAAERTRFINAYLTISGVGHPLKAQFDALVNKHQILFGAGIHGSSLFLPWHREYIWDLENLLRQVDCRVTVPYWRWSLEANNPFASTIWGAGGDALGGNGVPAGNCINTGPFAPPWQTSQPQCLRRNWNIGATLTNEATITQLIDVNCATAAQFPCFRTTLEGWHGQVHVVIGGQMGGGSSSNDPVFFLHHTYIDRLWARWQAKSAAHVTAYDLNPNLVMPGSATTPAHWFDLNAQGGNPNNRVCYVNPIGSITSVLDAVLRVPLAIATPLTDVVVAPDTSVVPVVKALDADRPCVPPPDEDLPTKGYCFNATTLPKIPRTYVYPFWDSWLREMGMTSGQIAEQRRTLYDAYNDPKTYNIISPSTAYQGGTLAGETGLFLYDDDYKCIDGPVTTEGCVGTDNGSTPPVDEYPVNVYPPEDAPYYDTPNTRQGADTGLVSNNP